MKIMQKMPSPTKYISNLKDSTKFKLLSLAMLGITGLSGANIIHDIYESEDSIRKTEEARKESVLRRIFDPLYDHHAKGAQGRFYDFTMSDIPFVMSIGTIPAGLGMLAFARQLKREEEEEAKMNANNNK